AHSDTRTWIDKQAVLCQEPGEEHPMPVLVGDLGDKGIVTAQLAGFGAQPTTQTPLILRHARVGLVFVDRESCKGGTRRRLPSRPRCDNRTLERLTKLALERRHLR